ncbi:hypothetical protein QBC39DRAFT_429675 [Podospora conica]|nr:hypothetical protein QBC39DRAFT_429675 [Schizothecium conicum]
MASAWALLVLCRVVTLPVRETIVSFSEASLFRASLNLLRLRMVLPENSLSANTPQGEEINEQAIEMAETAKVATKDAEKAPCFFTSSLVMFLAIFSMWSVMAARTLLESGTRGDLSVTDGPHGPAVPEKSAGMTLVPEESTTSNGLAVAEVPPVSSQVATVVKKLHLLWSTLHRAKQQCSGTKFNSSEKPDV